MIAPKTNSTSTKPVEQFDVSASRIGRWGLVAFVVAAALALLAAVMSESGIEHLLHSYLVSVCFVVSLGLGALFFVLIQHLTRAGWSVVVRRIAEVMAASLPYALLLFAPLLLLLLVGDSRLYSWNDATLRESDSLIQGKAAYLNAPFFVVRTLIYFAVWSVIARYFWRTSLRQDASGDKQLTLNMQKWSGPAMMAFAVTTCFAAFDWLMSLDPHWFSTIYGIYFFSGAVVGFLACLTLATMGLERFGLLRNKVTEEHYHDLGKLLLGFLMFWAYIAFSQYLLIWYADIPEETAWYLVRQNGGWQWVSLALLFGHFVLPFCGLMSRRAKRSRLTLASWAAWLLVMHWIDLYYLVMPTFSPTQVPLGIIDLFVLVGVAAFTIVAVSRVVGSRAIVPIRDPRLRESLSFHNA